jgi:metallo-beta-lactamase family protein
MKETSQLKLSFHGGVETTTGSNFLLEDEREGGLKLLVDCGLFQGTQICDDCNHDAFSYDPSSVDVLIVTHAHLDHVGRIPLLVDRGFNGVIYSTVETKEIAEVMLRDSVRVLAREARVRKREMIYNEGALDKMVSLWKTVSYHERLDLGRGFSFKLLDAGHILGSSMVEILYGGKKVVFTGDLGNSPAPLLRDTEEITDADYLIMESTYGDRDHGSKAERRDNLKDIIKSTIQGGGALLVPAFSIERTQVLLHEINHLVEERQIPKVPVFLDSPLAIKVTDIYRRHKKQFKQKVRDEISGGDDIFDFPGLRKTRNSKDSRAIADIPNPKIIIAGSGMSNGGRIRHHEKMYLGDPKSTLLIVGYQAAGSLGRVLQDGSSEVVIDGTKVKVRAKVVTTSGYSAHKDRENLIEFVSHTAGSVKKVFVVMGELHASLHLVQRLRDYLDVDAVAPRLGERVELEI